MRGRVVKIPLSFRARVEICTKVLSFVKWWLP